MTKPLVEQIRARKRTRVVHEEEKPSLFIPTGSTLLNLALSERGDGGYAAGKVANVIGDSHAGKTMLCLTTLAECVYSPLFDKHDLYYDDVENACEFNVPLLFGQKVADRLLPPQRDKQGDPVPSDLIEDFHNTMTRLLQARKPFVYVLDSLDQLSSREEVDRSRKEAAGKEIKGSYKLEVPKLLGQIMREISRDLDTTNSLLIVVSQTRDNIGNIFVPKTRSGGKALEFAASYVMWLSAGKAIQRELKGIKHQIGAGVWIKVSKNKITGKVRKVEFPIYYDYGVDDLGSCVNWLVKNKIWEKIGGRIVPKGLFDEEHFATKELISIIEEQHKQAVVQALVQKAWMEIEEGLKLGRPRRYE